jgi:hypothetical protein
MEPAANAPLESKSNGWSEVNACLGSASFHMLFLIALGLISIMMSGSSSKEPLKVSLGSGPGDSGGDAGTLEGSASLDELIRDGSKVSPSELLAAEKLLTSPSVLPPSDNATSSFASSMDSLLDLTNISNVLLDNSAAAKSGGSSSKAGLGWRGTGDEGDGTGGGGDPNGQRGFFGIPSHGKSVFYILDSSGSMEEHGKFKLACKELLYSLSQLTSKQKFFVILYSDGAYPMDADEAVPGTPDQISQVREWLEKVEPNGGTQPLAALKYALGMKPDEIYFLSDGQFDPSLLLELKKANPGRRIPIHTIDLMNYQTTGLMKMISRQSGGKFRFVK